MVNGRFQCLGPPQRLKTRFGKGYTLVVKARSTRDGAPGATGPIKAFVAQTFADPEIAALAARFSHHDDGNADPNALSPQRLVVTLGNGSRVECGVPATLGAPQAPLLPAQAAAKRDLCRRLAFAEPDLRLFDAPHSYLTDPQ